MSDWTYIFSKEDLEQLSREKSSSYQQGVLAERREIRLMISNMVHGPKYTCCMEHGLNIFENIDKSIEEREEK